MSYSPEALRFETIPVRSQVRVEDRVSFLYLDKARVVQDRTGILALTDDGTDGRLPIQIPSASLATLLLGPGTSITHKAASTLASSGATVIFTGGNGFPAYSTIKPLTSSARYAQAQCLMWSNQRSRLAAARTLYTSRFGKLPGADNFTIRQLRGLEGRLVRDEYARLTKKYNQKGFRRNPEGDDSLNGCLNVANAILYGVAATVCQAMNVNPALGVIHHGDSRAFLYDLADVFKLETSVPAAFISQSADDPILHVRTEVRRLVYSKNVMSRMVNTVIEILAPHMDKQEGDTLIDDDGDIVPGHKNYAGE